MKDVESFEVGASTDGFSCDGEGTEGLANKVPGLGDEWISAVTLSGDTMVELRSKLGTNT